MIHDSEIPGLSPDIMNVIISLTFSPNLNIYVILIFLINFFPIQIFNFFPLPFSINFLCGSLLVQ